MLANAGHARPSRRWILKGAGAAVCTLPFRADGFQGPTLRLFGKGRWNAVVLLDPEAKAQVREAACTLARYLFRCTGVEIPIVERSGSDQRIRIRVGLSSTAAQFGTSVQGMSPDGFVIDCPSEFDILIAGPTPWGTEFGVYEFLERYAGVTWLFPGPRGEYIPRRETIDIPMQPVRQEPMFLSRMLSGLMGAEQETWARRNRMRGRIEFHHNLGRLFPPERYGKTHPGFFPVINGKRYVPLDSNTKRWQPCFTASGLVQEAIKNVCEYFAQRPEATSYSLGVNDSNAFCECAECDEQGGSKPNFLGLHDSSTVYFTWANAVASGVLEKYPDKWFGCLAYREVAQAPSVPVHPRIIPFLTYDRARWADPLVEARGKQVSEEWAARAAQTGWYDYIYGTPYCLPRVYTHKMGEYLRYASSHGVRALYAEAYPNWGEGPKLYIALKLQWNPALDVGALLREWCEKAVGRRAAPSLEAYFRLWERFWTQTVLASRWFTGSRGEYLPFASPEYLDEVTDEIFTGRALLEAVVAKTDTPERLGRARLLLRAFEYYEASAVSYRALKEGRSSKSSEAMVAPGTGPNEESVGVRMREKRLPLTNEFEGDPVLAHPLRFDKYKALQW